MNYPILGTWQMGGAGWTTVDKDEGFKALCRAIEMGARCFDTAPTYGDGEAETAVGRLIAAYPNANLRIITKVPPDHMTAKLVRKTIESSLCRLGVDHVDTVLIHWPAGTMGTDVVDIRETVDGLQKAKEDKLIGKVGVCNFELGDLKKVAQLIEIECVQYAYSMIFRGVEFGIKDFAKANQIEFQAYATLGQGILTSKRSYNDFREDDHRNYVVLFGDTYRQPIEQVRAALARGFVNGDDRAAYAMKWVVDRGARPIVGMHKLSHLHLLESRLGLAPANSALIEVEAVSEKLKSEMGGRISLWG